MSKLQLVIGSANKHKIAEIQRMLSSVPSIEAIPFGDLAEVESIEEDGKTFAENAGKKALLYAKYLYAKTGVSMSGRHTALSTDTDHIEIEAARRARDEAERMLGLDRQGGFGSRVVMNADSHRIKRSDVLVMADDSGIAVDTLGGAPGINSARFAGKRGDDRSNNRKLLDEMKNVPDKKRTARFVCAIALATQNGVIFTVEGKVEGSIALECRGKHGFGYDSLFYYKPFEATFGEVDATAKDSVSHRANALKLFKSRLMRLLTQEGLV